LKQIDVILKKHDTSNLYASLAVKLHACLMRMIDAELANDLHNSNIHRYEKHRKT
jgi:hypothetical protein